MRILFSITPRLFLSCLFISAAIPADAALARAQNAQVNLSRPAPVSIAQVYSGERDLVQAMQASRGGGRVVVTADFSESGAADLVIGYAVGGGGAVALQRGAGGEFASKTVLTPMNFAPDFMKAADVDGDGHLDLVMAARGGHSVTVLPGDGRGGFGAARVVPVAGAISALGTWRGFGADKDSIVVGGCADTCSVGIYGGDGAQITSFGLDAEPSAIEVAGVNGRGVMDIAVIAGGNGFLLDGKNALNAGAGFETLPVRNVTAIAAGRFVYDHRGFAQLAFFGADGSVHVVGRPGIDSHAVTAAEIVENRRATMAHRAPVQPSPVGLGWVEIENTANVAPGPVAGRTPIMVRARLSGSGGDDLLIYTNGQLTTLAHPQVEGPVTNGGVDGVRGAAANVVTKAVVRVDPSVGDVTAAVAGRMGGAGQQAVLATNSQVHPATVAVPTIAHTFTVNSLGDAYPGVPGNCPGASCSLRDAVAAANTNSATNRSGGTIDKIVLTGAGTVTLVGHGSPDTNGNLTYHMEISGPIDFVSSSSSNAIIDGGNHDKIFSINSGNNGVATSVFDVFFDHVTLQNGTNFNDPTGATPSANNFGGLIDWETSGTGYLTLTNCTLKNGTNGWGPGGAIATSDSTAGGAGLLEIDNSTLNNNSTSQEGGALYLGVNSPLLLNNVSVTSNVASTTVNATDPGRLGQGGGIFLEQNSGSGLASVISGTSPFTSNTSSSDGGAIYTNAGLTISKNSFTSNSAGGNGGAIYHNTNGETTTATALTLTGNSASGDGGAIALGNNTSGNVFNMHYSRIHGNSAVGGHAGLLAGTTGVGGTASLTNNWWGCNSPPLGTSCDMGLINGGTITISPYVNLTMTLTPNPVPATAFKYKYGSTVVATADMAHDNTGAALSVGNTTLYQGLADTIVVHQAGGNVTNTFPSNLSVDANVNAATSTISLPIPGADTAAVTVDGFTNTVNFSTVAADMVIASAHTNYFHVGDTGKTYTLTVSNTGTLVSDPVTVTATDTLPTGFVATAVSGTGWACAAPPTVQCTRSDALALGTSYPVINVTVNVPNTAGSFVNSVTVSGGGEYDTTNDTGSDTTLVVAPVTLAEAFSPAYTQPNTSKQVVFTLTNPAANATTQNAIGFGDALPTNLTVAALPGVANTCGGTVTATGGTSTLSLTGATLASGASCTVGVNLMASAAGVYTNTTTAPSSTEGGAGLAASATLTVDAPPTMTALFGAATIPLNGTTSLTFSISNPNTTALNGIAFTDTLPAGLVVSTPNGSSGTCGAGTISAVAGSSTVSLSGGTLAGSANCSFQVNLTGTTAGTKSNSVTVSATEGGTGTSATASVNVIAPPGLTKSFGAATIPVGGSTALTFVATNSSTTNGLTGVAFTDSLPAGLVVSTPNGLSGSCGSGTITAVAGSGSVSLTGGTIAASGSCTFSVSVTGTSAGTKSNVTGSITSTEGGTGSTASASVTVLSPPTIAKAFSGTSVPVNGTTTLTFTLGDGNATTLTGVAFSDTFPSGMVVASPNGLVNNCGGTATATAGASSVSLTGASVAAGTCTMAVNVLASTAGTKTNTTGTVSSTNGGTGTTASANIIVANPPSIATSFGAANIQLNASTTISYTITNPNTITTLSGVGFTDTLPAGLVVANPNGVTGTCGSGTITAVAGSGTISLSGGNIGISGSCTFGANVTGTTSGTKSNSVTATSTEGGTGNTASASVTVALGASKLGFGTTPASPITAGGNAGSAITVSELDSTSTLVTGASDLITLTVTGPNSYTQTYTATASSGVATFDLHTVSLTASGTYVYTATSGSLTQATSSETVNFGAFAALSVSGFPIADHVETTHSVTVAANDSFGNVVTSFAGTVTITSSDTLAQLPIAYTYNGGSAAGTHSFSVTLNTAGTQSITATSGAVSGSETGIVVDDTIWVVNADRTIARLNNSGAINNSGGSPGTAGTSAVAAFDHNGVAYVGDSGSNSIAKFDMTGGSLGTLSGGGLSAPSSLAVDGAGQIWAVNGNGSLTEFSSAGTAITPATGFQGGNLSSPSSVVIDGSGSVWVVNSGNGTVTKFFGGAAPVLTPTVTATTNNALGTRP